MKLMFIGLIPILLLLGVGASVVLNMNLINSVSKMEPSIEESYQEELEFEGISIGNTTYNSLEEYYNSQDNNY